MSSSLGQRGGGSGDSPPKGANIASNLPEDEELFDSIIAEDGGADSPSESETTAALTVVAEQENQAGSSPSLRPVGSSLHRYSRSSLALVPRAEFKTGPSAHLYEVWREVDADGSGMVSFKEFQVFGARLLIKNIDQAWSHAVSFMHGGKTLNLLDAVQLKRHEVNYYAFVHSFNHTMGAERRLVRQQVRSAFFSMQQRREGPAGLTKAELGGFVRRYISKLQLLPPEFSLDLDWGLMSSNGDIVHVAASQEEADDVETVTFVEFERWWKRRMGLWETSQPVLPEFFEYKMRSVGGLDATMKHQPSAVGATVAGRQSQAGSVAISARSRWLHARGIRTGKELWALLKPKMLLVITLMGHWGDIDNHATGSSMYHVVPLPWFIRDPNSHFSGAWDLLSVVFLLYVCLTVPVRACFPDGIQGNKSFVEPWTLAWSIDHITDVFFISDMILNFYTAFANPWDGTLCIDRREIAAAYVRGWFAVDFVSCIPVQYVAKVFASESDMDLRFLKSLRLLRLSKMLRLARIKRIMAKYENLESVQQYGQLAMILFVIVGTAHVLTCFWYLVGTTDETLQGVLREGWVHTEWHPANDTTVTFWTRYSASIYSVFNVMDRGSVTVTERSFAVFGHVVLILVDGAVAGVMSALMISIQGQERDYNEKIMQAKQWMIEQRIPRKKSEPALEYFRSFYKSSVACREAEILSVMTPTMKMDFAVFLYGSAVREVPLFCGLSDTVVRALCNIVEPTFAVRTQVIYAEGSSGRELYIVLSGELEISVGSQRLGFISDGGFFGEVPILESGAHAELRRRTVTAVTACKLCFIRADSLIPVRAVYPELAMRLRRCGSNHGKTKGKQFNEAMDEMAATGVIGIKPTKASVFSSGLSHHSSVGVHAGDQGGAMEAPSGNLTRKVVRSEMQEINRKVDLLATTMASQQEQILAAIAKLVPGA